jgi:hypothetical protein
MLQEVGPLANTSRLQIRSLYFKAELIGNWLSRWISQPSRWRAEPSQKARVGSLAGAGDGSGQGKSARWGKRWPSLVAGR